MSALLVQTSSGWWQEPPGLEMEWVFNSTSLLVRNLDRSGGLTINSGCKEGQGKETWAREAKEGDDGCLLYDGISKDSGKEGDPECRSLQGRQAGALSWSTIRWRVC